MGQREDQLAAVAEAHYRWTQALADRVPFQPEANAGSRDYNVEHVELEANGDDHDAFIRSVRSGGSSAGTMGTVDRSSDGS